MSNSDHQNCKSGYDASPPQLSNTVETLTNILYLMELTVQDPRSVRELLKMAEKPMEALRNLASRRPVFEEDQEAPQGRRRPPLNEPEGDRTDPLPLAAAGGENPPSQDGASPGNRIEEPEAD